MPQFWGPADAVVRSGVPGPAGPPPTDAQVAAVVDARLVTALPAAIAV